MSLQRGAEAESLSKNGYNLQKQVIDGATGTHQPVYVLFKQTIEACQNHNLCLTGCVKGAFDVKILKNIFVNMCFWHSTCHT